tara:strand:- start:824 stop:1360 length:537 start_codon:yes stop_codon:yes gene_type:complete
MPIDYFHIITPPVVAYVNHLHVPDIGGPESDYRYKITILVNKQDSTCIKAIVDASHDAARLEWPVSWDQALNMPLHDGIDKCASWDQLADYLMCTFHSYHPPLLQMPDGSIMPRSIEIPIGASVRVFGAMGGCIVNGEKTIDCYLSGVQLLGSSTIAIEKSTVYERFEQLIDRYLPWR